MPYKKLPSVVHAAFAANQILNHQVYVERHGFIDPGCLGYHASVYCFESHKLLNHRPPNLLPEGFLGGELFDEGAKFLLGFVICK